jgi:phosphatidylglycerophosphate synthase
VRTVRTTYLFALVAQVALVAVLAGTVGLGVAGGVVGLACGVVTVALLGQAWRRSGVDRPGPADLVTLTRATLVGGVAALVVDSFARPGSVGALAGLAVVALLLDAVDGRVARRTGTVSSVGARFDMEVDAFLILVLSVAVSRSLGGWVLGIGLARYAFVAAGWALPWLRRPTPPRFWCKVVAAIQGVALTTVVAGVLPTAVARAALVLAMLLLAESFGRDIGWLARTHRVVVVGPASLESVRA